MKVFNDNLVHIYPQDKNSNDFAVDLLTKSEVQFYSYTPKDLKPRAYIIRGLSGEIADSEVQAALETNKIHVTRVQNFPMKISIQKKVRSNLFVAYIPRTENPPPILKLTQLNAGIASGMVIQPAIAGCPTAVSSAEFRIQSDV